MNYNRLKSEVELLWCHREGKEIRAEVEAGITPGVFVCRRTAYPSEWLELRIPLRSIGGIWSPYGDWNSGKKVIWQGRELGSPFFKPGVMACVDRNLRNRFAFAPASLATECRFSWQISQAWGCYLFRIEWPDDELKELIFVRDVCPVHEAVDRMITELYQSSGVQASPSEFYEPSYCTWYAFHADLQQKNVEACAKQASELGFGTFVLDDGWQYDEPQRVSGELGRWHRFQGGYQPSKRKFPRFGEFFEFLDFCRLRKILWVAPFLIGEDHDLCRKFSEKLLPSWLNEGFRLADPRDDGITEHLEHSLCNLVREFKLDGFKVDYDYSLISPDFGFRGLGRAYCTAVERWIRAVRQIRPNFEWNLIPNTFSCAVTNAFRCVDVPFDPETNRMSMANFKSLVGARALQYDPALWRSDEDLSIVYRHLLPSLFCVPSVGVNLCDIPPAHRDAIRAVLGFYRRHQPLLNSGGFSTAWYGGDFQSFRTSNWNEEISISFSGFPVAVDARRTWVINGDASADVSLNFHCSGSVVVEDLNGEVVHGAVAVRPGLRSMTCGNAGVIRYEPE